MGGGGAERVGLTLINHFIEAGHKVDLLLMQASGALMPLIPPEVEIVDLQARRIRDAFRSLRTYLRQVEPAAIQVSMWPLTVIAIMARIAAGVKTRVVVSDQAVLSRQYAHRGKWHRALLKWSIRLFYPRADARVVVAAETAQDLSHLSGLPGSAFEVIHNPVDPPKTDPAGVQGEELWKGPGKRIINVGRLAPQKNQSLLLEAFARLSADTSLVILGEGELRPPLERQARKLGIADRVAMPGFLLDPSPLLRSADLFALSSDYEGYPVVLIEALHCGLPIVSTDCPSGPAEILDRGRYGRLVPCGDADRLAEAIAEALESPDEPTRLKDRARELTSGTAGRYLSLMLGEAEPARGDRNTTAR